MIKGVGFKGEGTREPWGTLGKLREYKGTMGITRLPTPLPPPPLKYTPKESEKQQWRVEPPKCDWPIALTQFLKG